MLKRTAQIVFLVLLSFIWQSNANAQTPMAEFSYAEKTEAFRLAKAGDADALYKLGVSYYYGINSTQNYKVADRFFYYAARNGSFEAKQYMATKVSEAPSTVQTAAVSVENATIRQAKAVVTKKARSQARTEVQTQQRARIRQAKAEQKKARIKKNKIRAKQRALAKEKAKVTRTAGSSDGSSMLGSDDTVNPYTPTSSVQIATAINSATGLFLMGFFTLFMGFYIFASHYIKRRRIRAS